LTIHELAEFVDYNTWMGRPQSEESKRKIAETLKRKYADGTRKAFPGMAGKKHSEKTKQKMSKSAKKRIEEKPHTNQAGWNEGIYSDNPKYDALHMWAKKHLKKSACEFCGGTNNLDMANRTGQYLRQADDWQTLCRKCHLTRDRREGIHIHPRLLPIRKPKK